MNDPIILILPIMFFLHIVDDYNLQGILAKMKQRKFWEENNPNPLYKHDYIIALFEHAFSWSFMINIPWIIWEFWYKDIGCLSIIGIILINTSIHAYVDHCKCNKMQINLIQDQCIHFGQILATFVIYIIILWF